MLTTFLAVHFLAGNMLGDLLLHYLTSRGLITFSNTLFPVPLRQKLFPRVTGYISRHYVRLFVKKL